MNKYKLPPELRFSSIDRWSSRLTVHLMKAELSGSTQVGSWFEKCHLHNTDIQNLGDFLNTSDSALTCLKLFLEQCHETLLHFHGNWEDSIDPRIRLVQPYRCKIEPIYTQKSYSHTTKTLYTPNNPPVENVLPLLRNLCRHASNIKNL